MTNNSKSSDNQTTKKVATTKIPWKKPVIMDLQAKETFGLKKGPIKEGDMYKLS